PGGSCERGPRARLEPLLRRTPGPPDLRHDPEPARHDVTRGAAIHRAAVRAGEHDAGTGGRGPPGSRATRDRARLPDRPRALPRAPPPPPPPRPRAPAPGRPG